MGNKVYPVSDDGLACLQKSYKLTDRDIGHFWVVFKKNDKNGSRTMTIDDFFLQMLEEPRTYFGDAIFELVDIKKQDMIDFREFVRAVTTFALFQKEEIARLVFFVFDRKKKGYINHEAFQIFVDMSYEGRIKGNVATAIELMKLTDYGVFEYVEFCNLCDQFPDILRPVVRLQSKIRSIFFNEEWWMKKIKQLQYERDHHDEQCEKKRRKHEKKIMKERKRRIRAELGIFQYYFSKRRRKSIEDIFPIPIVFLDKDSNVKVKLPSNKYNVIWDKKNEGYMEST